jgi:uncharacterized protein YcgI (DUF1989 family)
MVVDDTNLVDSTDSTTVAFGSQAVDFNAFNLADPVTTWEAASTVQATLAVAAACLLSSF